MRDVANDPNFDPYHLVEILLRDFEQELYGSSQEYRLGLYEGFLSAAAQMVLIDGGPTVAIRLFKKEIEGLRTYESQRRLKVDGPFLSEARCDMLFRSPGAYLRQDILYSGPTRWTVVDDNAEIERDIADLER